MGRRNPNERRYGTDVTASHEYTTDGIFYAIVAGVIEEIESFTTNGIIVWNNYSKTPGRDYGPIDFAGA